MRKIWTAFMVAVLMLSVDLVWAETAQAELPIPGTSMGEAVIGFERGLLPQVAVGGLLEGLPVRSVSKNGSFITVAAPNLQIVRQMIAMIPGVSYVEDNGVMRALVTPNDPRYGTQYGPDMMGFPAAWSSTGYGSAAITVALIDSGVLKTHQDFAPGRMLQGRDYANNDADPNDDCGHGTHTAGTVGATTNNGIGVAGMSQAKILPMKALKYSSSFLSSGCSGANSNVAQAIIDAADQGANVISMSIGGGASSVIENAVNYAWGKGAILVAAAGNGGSANGIDYPGAYPNVIAVGALESNKTKASYSDGGPQLDIAAPGSGVISTYTGANNATYASLSGTSMATPHVAGAIALALGCAPAGTTRTQVIDALYSTAEDLGAAGRDNSYGYGLARADRLVLAVCPDAEPPPNQNPVANFTATKSGVNAVTVNGSSSTDPDGEALTYAWTFGDGGTATGVSASHTYAGPGTYDISLTVTDPRGGTNTKTVSYVVAANQAPTANFTATASGVNAVSVNGGSSTDPDGDSLTYAWTFGDGGTATGVSASHTYAGPGTYDISLTVNDGRGGTNTKTVSYVVPDDPDPGAPTLANGQLVSISVNASNADNYFKILVPAGKSQLKVVQSGPTCGFFNCPVDADLYVRPDLRPTDTVYSCRPNVKGNAETCTLNTPAPGYWYMRVKRRSGSGVVKLSATFS